MKEKEEITLGDAHSMLGIIDRGGRRSVMDRRIVFLPGYWPERRSIPDRRSGQERRGGKDLGDVDNLGRQMDRYVEYNNAQKGIFFGLLLSLPIWGLIIFIILSTIR